METITDVADRIERTYREEGARLWRALLAQTGNADLADDVVAEVFAQALARGQAISDPRAWVWRSAFRIAMGRLKETRGPVSLPELPYEMPPSTVDLVRALAALSPKQRASIVLHHYADYPVREVAEVIGSTSAAVKVHLSVGRKRLRAALEDHDDG